MRKWSPQRSRKEAGGRRASERTNVHLTFTFRIRQPAILYPPQYVISTWACPVCSARRHVTGTPSSSYSLFSFLFFRYSYPSMRRASAAHSTSPAPKTTPSRRPTLEMHDSDDDEEFIRTKILVMGQRRCVPSVEFICSLHVWITLFISIANTFRSGKTSILKVLFEGLNPKQAFFTEPTTRLTKYKIEYVMQNARSCAQVLTAYKFR